uniref:C2H2-type domain-containing protein n=1 Tax=Trichuris muris TaxID=70415 RepID=A0A5S6QD84_TRIMR
MRRNGCMHFRPPFNRSYRGLIYGRPHSERLDRHCARYYYNRRPQHHYAYRAEDERRDDFNRMDHGHFNYLDRHPWASRRLLSYHEAQIPEEEHGRRGVKRPHSSAEGLYHKRLRVGVDEREMINHGYYKTGQGRTILPQWNCTQRQFFRRRNEKIIHFSMMSEIRETNDTGLSYTFFYEDFHGYRPRCHSCRIEFQSRHTLKEHMQTYSHICKTLSYCSACVNQKSGGVSCLSNVVRPAKYRSSKGPAPMTLRNCEVLEASSTDDRHLTGYTRESTPVDLIFHPEGTVEVEHDAIFPQLVKAYEEHSCDHPSIQVMGLSRDDVSQKNENARQYRTQHAILPQSKEELEPGEIESSSDSDLIMWSSDCECAEQKETCYDGVLGEDDDIFMP